MRSLADGMTWKEGWNCARDSIHSGKRRPTLVLVDDDARKSLIYELTDRFGIYSFGRFATWKPIRTDHLVGDIDVVKKLMAASSMSYHVTKQRSK